MGSIVVSGTMFYFIWNLMHEDFVVPRTLWTLQAASILTFLFLIGSTILYAFFGLSPLVNLIGNTACFLLWGPGFGYLWFYTSPTLAHVCNRKNWTGPTGIMVCRIYKSLFAFALLGTLTTLAALLLDVYVWRKTISRGKYSQMKGDKPAGISAPGEPYNAPAYSDSRSSLPMEQYTTPNTQKDDHSGYTMPEEQFSYDQDTSYRGGHEPDPSKRA